MIEIDNLDSNIIQLADNIQKLLTESVLETSLFDSFFICISW